ncbi:MAG: Holliday junction branch migration protein RuvA [Acidimicrobiia bacterium]|nr:Holliday junction branch migration protein RuvA [Acidimicrobiia bacterium]
MIGSLRGSLLECSAATELLVEVAGVGYRVQVTPETAAALGAASTEVFIYIHHALREDSETLYGFCSADERGIFESLISAHGVGPALGLAILSVHSPVALRAAVARDDLDALCLVPGVGKKTAARLVMELKNKLDIADGETVGASAVSAAAPHQGAQDDVRAALENLGYAANEIHAALSEVRAEGADKSDSSELLKNALRRLATGA